MSYIALDVVTSGRIKWRKGDAARLREDENVLVTVIDDGTPNEAQDKRWHAYVKGLKYAGKEFTEDVEKEVAKLHEKEGGTAWEDELVRYNPEDPENQG